MPKTIAQSLNLFPADVTSSTLTEMLRLEDMQGFSHSTTLPGGFGSLSFTLPLTEAKFWDWRINRMLARMLIQEDGGRVIWEGRLEIPDLSDLWLGKMTFKGYWSNFTDAVQTGGSTAYNTTGDAIIQDLRDTHMHADTLQLSTSNAEMDAPGVTIVVDYTNDNFNLWQMITDNTKGVLKWANSSAQKMDLAVWEDRVIHYKARNPSVVTWESFIGQGVRRLPVRVNWQELANTVLQIYESTGTVTRGTATTNAASIAKYLRRERALPNIGESTSAAANLLRDAEIESRRELQQQSDNLVITQVWDTNSVEWPLCRVRAGEVLRIPDFTPKTSDLDAVTLDGYRTFFIEETTCDHTAGTLTIRPDRSGTSLSGILSRARVI